MSLLQVIRKSLENDVIDGVLNDGHLAALDRRIDLKVVVTVLRDDCIKNERTSESSLNTRLNFEMMERAWAAAAPPAPR
jgi:hypothetical protein